MTQCSLFCFLLIVLVFAASCGSKTDTDGTVNVEIKTREQQLEHRLIEEVMVHNLYRKEFQEYLSKRKSLREGETFVHLSDADALVLVKMNKEEHTILIVNYMQSELEIDIPFDYLKEVTITDSLQASTQLEGKRLLIGCKPGFNLIGIN